MRPRILLFVKAPLPGQVKTRLAATIGAEPAAALYRRLMEHCLHSALDAKLGSVVLFATPKADDEFLLELARRHRLALQPQAGADLGERMANALAWSCADGTPSLLIGSDCAVLTPHYLRDAAAALAGNDIVLGPAEDGGYFLIGMRRAHAQVFRDIAWSSPQVLAQTRQRIAAAGLSWTELAPVWDVDEPADLTRLAQLDAFREGLAPVQ